MNDAPSPMPAGWALVFGAWLVASSATPGALFFSEVMNLPPCVLCWWQRIFMFPLLSPMAFTLLVLLLWRARARSSR